MADAEQLKRAFMKAHKAGDTKAAAALARAIKAQGSASIPPATAPVQQPAPVEAAPPERSGSILPISSTPDGGWQFDSNAGLVGMVKRALALPGDVYTGKVQMTGPDGRTSDEAIRRSTEMAGVVTPVSPALSAGEKAIPGVANSLRQGKVAPPSQPALREAGTSGYNAAREISDKFSYDPRVTSRLGDFFRAEMRQKGFNPEGSKQTFAVLNEYFGPNAPPITNYRDFLTVKDALQKIRMSPDASDKAAAELILERVYKFVEKADPRTVMAGSPAATGAKLIGGGDMRSEAIAAARETGRLNAEARGNYAASKRSELVTGKIDKADRQAAKANSGLNLDNTLRQRADDILSSDKLKKGYSPFELEMFRRVVDGDRTTNTLRFVANILGGGGGLGMSVGGTIGAAAGAALGGPIGAAVGAVGAPAVGFGLKKTGGALTKKAMLNADAAVRSRSPLYQQMLLEAPLIAPSQAMPAAVMRGGMAASPSMLDMLFQREKN
jgi:hypothetical protein